MKINDILERILAYPKKPRNKGIQGRVHVIRLFIEKTVYGNLKVRGPDKSFRRWSRRIISLTAPNEGGKHKEKGIKVSFSIPYHL